jgi:hypothetical protein
MGDVTVAIKRFFSLPSSHGQDIKTVSFISSARADNNDHTSQQTIQSLLKMKSL